ncbi:uncharacterized protein [Musca autumnalis]|uniref:uncharacterized protein n=1 Tax=Musca autumnalis TaxID=221902 RepID=UPI003CEAD45F
MFHIVSLLCSLFEFFGTFLNSYHCYHYQRNRPKIKIEPKEENNGKTNEAPTQVSSEKELQETEETHREQQSTSLESQLDELDITSENFNPLRCLYANDFRVTEKQPKVIYQNMAAFETALKKLFTDVKKKKEFKRITPTIGSNRTYNM